MRTTKWLIWFSLPQGIPVTPVEKVEKGKNLAATSQKTRRMRTIEKKENNYRRKANWIKECVPPALCDGCDHAEQAKIFCMQMIY